MKFFIPQKNQRIKLIEDAIITLTADDRSETMAVLNDHYFFVDINNEQKWIDSKELPKDYKSPEFFKKGDEIGKDFIKIFLVTDTILIVDTFTPKYTIFISETSKKVEITRNNKTIKRKVRFVVENKELNILNFRLI